MCVVVVVVVREHGEKHGVVLKGLALSHRKFMEKRVGGEGGHINQGALG